MLSSQLTRLGSRYALYRRLYSASRSSLFNLQIGPGTTYRRQIPASLRTIATTASCSERENPWPVKEPQQPTFLIFPEVPNDTIETNEFLEIPTTGQIPFDALTVEKCVRASGKLSIEFEHFIDEFSRTLKEEFEDQDISNAKLNEFVTQMESHLLPLHYNLTLLNSFRIIRSKEFNFGAADNFFHQRYTKTKLRFLNRYIYCFMCELKARRENGAEAPAKGGKPESPSEEVSFLQAQRHQLVDRYIRESKLLGFSLKHQDQVEVYNLLGQRLAVEQANFTSTADTATGNFQANIISPQFLDCLPDHVITQINHHDAQSVFNSFMRYCPDQNLRKDFWLSYHSRAAPYFGSKLNNYLTIEKIRHTRHQKARLLGYDNFAALSVDLRGAGGPTMAGSVENVRAFVNGLGMRTDGRFQKNLKELTEFATEGAQKRGVKPTGPPSVNNFVESLNLWDLKYFERLFLRETYQLDSREIRAHFPLEKVVSGMFAFAETLFGIKIMEVKEGEEGKSAWGPNMRHYKVFDNSAKSNAEYGSFYFDPFQRQSTITLPVSRSESLHTKPVVFFLMNFAAGNISIFDQYDNQMLATGKELLNFNQVIELFGKFGYVLQHLMTQVNYSEIGSLSNLEADAFHLVSHFMRMWPLNSYEVLAKCTSHIQTGEPMSEEFFQRIRKSYYHFVSLSLKNELYLMALDLNLHTLREHSSSLQKQTWKEWMQPFTQQEEDGHICSFGDIFSGTGQEGIYYADKWAEVIAADVFDAFRDDSRNGATLKSPEAIRALGLRFRDTFLTQNGAIETNELFRRFLGRDPSLNGYLSINGFE